MMNRPGILLLAAAAVAALQIGLLSWSIAGRAAILRDGQEVTLKVLPVDPRDLLRGDYVRLGYDISTVPAAQFLPPLSGDGDYVERPIWVQVKRQDDGFYKPQWAAFDRATLPAAQDGEVVLRGIAAGAPSATGTAAVEYGIERFYLPEGEGLEIERDMRERSFSIVAAVDQSGTAQIKRFLDGTTLLYEEPMY
jgi:uncharacterized membrane-anchored protein